MLRLNAEAEKPAVLQAAEQLCIAARTAPKGKGKDLLVTAIVTGEEKDQLCKKMREIAGRDQLGFFGRDAANVEGVEVVVLFGTRREPLGLPACGYCGFANCGAMAKAGAFCSFNVGDLGIALGSAASRAADLRLDNRIMYSLGKAALEIGLLGQEVALAYGIPLSATGKSPFFDRG